MAQNAVAAWNQYCLEFLHKLTETFPECPELFVAINAAEAKMEEDDMSVLSDFVDELDPYSAHIGNKDEEFFLSTDIDFLNRLNIVQFWTPDLEEETKETIWQYLQTMLVMAKTIKKVPTRMLRLIEQFASKVQAETPDGNFDPESFDMMTLGMGALAHIKQEDPEAYSQLQRSAPGVPTDPSVVGNFTSLAEEKPFAFPRPQQQQQHQPQSQQQQHIGWDKLQEMLGQQGVPPQFAVPGLGATFQQFQRREQIQRDGPIPPPAAKPLNSFTNYSVGAPRK